MTVNLTPETAAASVVDKSGNWILDYFIIKKQDSFSELLSYLLELSDDEDTLLSQKHKKYFSFFKVFRNKIIAADRIQGSSIWKTCEIINGYHLDKKKEKDYT